MPLHVVLLAHPVSSILTLPGQPVYLLLPSSKAEPQGPLCTPPFSQGDGTTQQVVTHPREADDSAWLWESLRKT